jgi:hypothetical protein
MENAGGNKFLTWLEINISVLRTEVYARRVKREGRKYKKMLKKSYLDYNNRVVNDLRTLKYGDPHKVWKMVSIKKNGQETPVSMLEDLLSVFKLQNTNDLQDEAEEPLEVGRNYILDRRIEKDEIIKAIKSLKRQERQAAWIKFQILFLMATAEVFIDLYCNIFNIVLESGKIHSSWTTGIIKPIYKKKGDVNDPSYYRGITLFSSLGKLFTSVLNGRIGEVVRSHKIIGKEQAGFRSGFSTIDHVFTLQYIVDLYLCKGKKLHVSFVDLKAAFDTVWRTGLWRKLIDSGINGKILTVIKNMYITAKSCVEVGNIRSDFFPCSNGVRQGENMSPLLFALYLNDFESFLQTNGFNGPRDLHLVGYCNFLERSYIYLKLAVLLYADDMILLGDSPECLQRGLDLLHEYCNQWHLIVNIAKTKIMIFSRGRARVNIPEFLYDGQGALDNQSHDRFTRSRSCKQAHVVLYQ